MRTRLGKRIDRKNYMLSKVYRKKSDAVWAAKNKRKLTNSKGQHWSVRIIKVKGGYAVYWRG